MFVKRTAMRAGACLGASLMLLALSAAPLVGLGMSTASAAAPARTLAPVPTPLSAAVPFVCSPSQASHTFTSNNVSWNMSFVKRANGCQSIWLVMTTSGTKPFGFFRCSATTGGCAVAQTQVDCPFNTACQLINPAQNNVDSVNFLEELASAPATVTVDY